jgi:arsenite-transporting ATPase
LSLKNLLYLSDLKFLLFGGKGGVGKTTAAVATSIYFAEQLAKKVLIISTDPAHSLADSFDISLTTGQVTPIKEIPNLWALEIDPESEQSQIAGALSMVPNLEQLPFMEGMMDMSELNPPGLDEALAFGKVLEYLDDSEFDIVIFDTAPTGHTLKLLSIPDMLSGWLGKLLMMRMRLSQFFSAFKSLFSKDETSNESPVKALKKLKSSIESAKEILQDPTKTQFVMCMIPEDMAIYETARLLEGLTTYHIPSQNIIVNQLLQLSDNCAFCKKRRDMQQLHLLSIKKLYEKRFTIVPVPLFDKEVRKIEILREYHDYLFND